MDRCIRLESWIARGKAQPELRQGAAQVALAREQAEGFPRRHLEVRRSASSSGSPPATGSVIGAAKATSAEFPIPVRTGFTTTNR